MGSLQPQYRRCGKDSCKVCRGGKGHGPYWYEFWREGDRVQSRYIGRTLPAEFDDHPDVLKVAAAFRYGKLHVCLACMGSRGFLGPDSERLLREAGIERIPSTAAMRGELAGEVCHDCASPVMAPHRRYGIVRK